ncbi:MAG TPA: regulatory protein RecX [Burkholderiales bacterium]|nr:regulatory protein RecX [Burkholderiales bacterium]
MIPTELRQKALRFLARREYSRSELKFRLGEEEGVEALLDELEEEGWLSDVRYVDQILNARLGRYGREHVLHELRSKGISEDLISSAIPRIMESEGEALKSVWEKKFGKLPVDRKELGKQVRFLQSRGFSLDEILKLIGKD